MSSLAAFGMGTIALGAAGCIAPEKTKFSAWDEVSLGKTGIRTSRLGFGTGVNADTAYLQRIVPVINEVSELDLIQAKNLIDATQNLDPFVRTRSSARRLPRSPARRTRSAPSTGS